MTLRDVDLSSELEFALSLADLADATTLQPFHDRGFTVDWKANRTEVTELDRRTEEVLADAIAHFRPDDAVFGEEFGERGAVGGSRWTWVLDPIDGTSNYARGVPVWATLIALLDPTDVPVLGVVSAPAIDARWHGAIGEGAYNRRGPLRVSTVARLDEAQISTTPNAGWEAVGGYQCVVDLGRRAYRARGFGDFWQHMLVAEGAIDAAVDAIGLEPYDTAALWPIVAEAGGRITDRLGGNSFRNGSAVSTNGLLHDTVLGAIAV
ncbi:MAG: histidinol phosphatase [Actinobacteria bacterium]|nr:histidinol phosphatase [Actinomycetota bacterium]